MSEWRPIESDKQIVGLAPWDGLNVLLAWGSGADGKAVGEGYYHIEDDGWYLANTDPSDHFDGSIHPTHWQPLPPPPGE